MVGGGTRRRFVGVKVRILVIRLDPVADSRQTRGSRRDRSALFWTDGTLIRFKHVQVLTADRQNGTHRISSTVQHFDIS